jgi:hypothetical protein
MFNAGMAEPQRDFLGTVARFVRLPRPSWIFSVSAVIALLAIGLRVGLPMYRELAAKAALMKFDGDVETENGGPDWLRRWIGDRRMEPFDHVTSVNLQSRAVTDSDLTPLHDLPQLWLLGLDEDADVTDATLENLRSLHNLNTLFLSGTGITDDGLVNLTRLPRLEFLDISGTAVTDTGLRNLGGLHSLESLDLDGTRVSDAGVRFLRGFPKLCDLRIGSTGITDDGLPALSEMPALRHLSLRKTQVTDAGMAHLRGLANLRHLNLRETEITDAGLESVTGNTKLESLDLEGTGVTDAGLAFLARLPALWMLSLSRTKVTDAGLEALKPLKNARYLESLDLRETAVSEEGIAELERDLPRVYIQH